MVPIHLQVAQEFAESRCSEALQKVTALEQHLKEADKNYQRLERRLLFVTNVC